MLAGRNLTPEAGDYETSIELRTVERKTKCLKV